jgi:Zn finger protein HypA/HybF involved in hydrogenase expression
MHEYSLVATLVERVEDVARKQGARTVERIEVHIGDRAGVERELFATAFDTFKLGILAQAALDIVATPGDEILLERVEMEVP